MATNENDNLELEKRNEDVLNYHSSSMPSDWQLSNNIFSNASVGLISSGNPMQSSSSNATVADSFCPTMWDQPLSSHNLDSNDNNVQHNTTTLNAFGSRAGCLGSLNAGLDSIVSTGTGQTLPDAMLRGSMFLPGVHQFLPQSLAHFPADAGFIKRAARYSCFSGGNFSEIINPFNISESMNPYSRGQARMPGSHEALMRDGLKPISGMQPQKNENMAESSKHVPLPAEYVVSDGNPPKNEKKSESLVRSRDEAKGGVVASGNESDEAEFSGQAGKEELEGADGEFTPKGIRSKKSKRCGQDSELDPKKGSSKQAAEASNADAEVQQKGDQNPNSSKPIGKNGRQGPQASGSPKEEYIHVRARRGQATNSHSLAERIRREKISERMKFLQDLVPGCNKVTGKAVMLDEIINYVQSLQHQVEFLSMKLATVNPQSDFNIEGLLTKDVRQSHAGPSSLAFSPDMTMAHPPLHQSQEGIFQANLHGLGNPSDALRRSINANLTTVSGSFKDPPSHVPNVWEDELHNIVQMGLNSSVPLSSQDINGSFRPGHKKAEI